MDHCKIVEDLMPLYVDGLTSEETSEYVREHTENCAACRTLLEQMSTPVEPETPQENGDFQKAIKKQRTKQRRTLAIVLAVGVTICLIVLQAMGAFSVLARQTSPDGEKSVVVYKGGSGTFYLGNEDFTIEHKKALSQDWRESSFSFGGTYGGSWFSPSGRFLVVAAIDEATETTWLSYIDYEAPEFGGYNSLLEAVCRMDPAFEPGIKAQGIWKNVEFRFMEWHTEQDLMLFNYTCLDANEKTYTGYFWFDPAEKTINLFEGE